MFGRSVVSPQILDVSLIEEHCSVPKGICGQWSNDQAKQEVSTPPPAHRVWRRDGAISSTLRVNGEAGLRVSLTATQLRESTQVAGAHIRESFAIDSNTANISGAYTEIRYFRTKSRNRR